MSRKLIKATAVTGSMTLLSRISGLVRDIAFASIMGSGLVADAFFVAFRVPNFFRRIFGEGALSQAFVPVFSEYKEAAAPEQTQAFLDHVAGKLAVILALITAAGILIAPGFVTVIAPGFLGDNQKFQLTVDALRICFPYLIFISFVAVSAGILNTCGRFAVPAATPVLLNLCLIGAAFWLVPILGNAAIALSVGVVIAGLAQLMLQIPFLRREGHLPKPKIARSDDGVRKVFQLMLPAIFGVSVAQINVLVNTLLASFLVTGSVSWLYYADRLMEFPAGMLGAALGTILLPSLARVHAKADADEYARLLDWVLPRPFLTLLVAVVLLAGSLSLYPHLGQELVPELVQGEFYVDTELPPGTHLEVNQRRLARLEGAARELDNVASVYANPFCHGGSANSHYGGNAKTYMDVGLAMGEAMVELLKKGK